MDMNRFTQKSQEAIAEAQNIAIRMNHQAVDGDHLLLALCDQDNGLISRLFLKMDVPFNDFRERVLELLRKIPQVTGSGVEAGKVLITPRLSQILVKAQDEAKRLKDEYVSVEHLIIAIIEEGKDTAAGRLLKEHSISRNAFLKALQDIRGHQRVQSANPEASYEALEKYGRDLVADAKRGNLDPVIGRDAEIRRVIRILSRKTKNNPVLIGEPGVGKTAIAEGLAQRILRGDVPEGLKDRTVFALDMGSLVAVAKFSG